MVALRTLLVRLAKEEHGVELVEYALVLGLIAIGALAAMQVVGMKVQNWWNMVSGASW
jgi:Flp pilus assembly pilin Flp